MLKKDTRHVPMYASSQHAQTYSASKKHVLFAQSNNEEKISKNIKKTDK